MDGGAYDEAVVFGHTDRRILVAFTRCAWGYSFALLPTGTCTKSTCTVVSTCAMPSAHRELSIDGNYGVPRQHARSSKTQAIQHERLAVDLSMVDG